MAIRIEKINFRKFSLNMSFSLEFSHLQQYTPSIESKNFFKKIVKLSTIDFFIEKICDGQCFRRPQIMNVTDSFILQFKNAKFVKAIIHNVET
ncbi:hypothetical protein BpHYR1_017826 [Brachionus plicatilis]|uniref:Uncharacterized protein n=1 Tax=Brachionus plicatilis TaxID=10195 RepID=A0A3M7RMG5_BRAPC|nr:hypothetical protein BpHYR1_017826 [Brachionus plicatilis]